mmetsp:Transcript_2446/g.6099  ORF Transcript_2446/g.6099 Transcript_2446/m.6099 type:complete len:221 (-) Transcript_2446:539-1201(-)
MRASIPKSSRRRRTLSIRERCLFASPWSSTEGGTLFVTRRTAAGPGATTAIPLAGRTPGLEPFGKTPMVAAPAGENPTAVTTSLGKMATDTASLGRALALSPVAGRAAAAIRSTKRLAVPVGQAMAAPFQKPATAAMIAMQGVTAETGAVGRTPASAATVAKKEAQPAAEAAGMTAARAAPTAMKAVKALARAIGRRAAKKAARPGTRVGPMVPAARGLR